MIFLPLKKENRCYIFSSLTGEKLSYFECEDIGKQSKDLIPVKFKGKWGYINGKGIWIIEPKFDFADNFYKDLARVRINQKYGFINKKGEVVIDLKFRYAGSFIDNDIAPIQCNEDKNDLYGYIDITGKIIIPCEFQNAYEFINNVARARKWDLYGYIFYDNKDKKRKILQNFQYKLAGDFGTTITYVLKKNGFVFIEPDGKIKKQLDSSLVPDSFSFTDPLAKIQDLNTGWYGYIDKEFRIQIPAIFLKAEMFYLGYAKVIGPKIYQNIDIDVKEVEESYKKNNYEEFYIDTLGRRITFWD
ncbi:MAG: hypothetical protein KatS3mg129_0444 [Leptospiraceae bacterium]|nr:MAG: hypothetical protein KatS3mg129_0444 [Leptospiraceae bacterium]